MYTNTRSLTPPVSARAHPILTPNDTATPTPATPRPSHPHPQWREPTRPYSNKVALNILHGLGDILELTLKLVVLLVNRLGIHT